ncbi:glycosyltransferase family 9 protein [Phycicoccus sp. M110.8]|uniref:glycosyltransferase family 9 protein n=1 Tax=Phycicoccus sp. M110.8 TaxID=3075433 RepID=UPI0028FD2088|nr:glycosyltransferase family 9 protein [Phycicoccus sp. M110.8]MDU0315376.1 glycosyltransferase family 9 protein [Phycicoccus sp. M110.8]
MTRVLVLRALGLGDLLTGVPVLRGLRRRHPDAHLVLAAPARLGPWFTDLGLVDEVLPSSGLAPLTWAGPPPDLAVDLHGRGPESHRLLEALGPRRLLGFACPEADHVDGPPWLPDEHEVDRWVRLAAWGGVPCSVEDLRLPSDGARRDHVVVHPGAAAGSRRWPAERWAEVAAALAEDGHPVVVTGSPAEAALCARVAAHAGVEDCSGVDDLPGLFRRVATAALVLSGDTGPAHLATASATPSVVLCGPVDPAHWGPRIDGHLHRVLWHPRPGDPAGDPHADDLDPRLARTTVPEVLEAARTLLAARPVGTSG